MIYYGLVLYNKTLEMNRGKSSYMIGFLYIIANVFLVCKYTILCE